MARLTKAQQVEQADAIEKMRVMFPHGSTARLVLRHVSRSGMSRSIGVIGPDDENVSGLVAIALDWPRDHKNGGIKVTGCGMDMGFHLVYVLSSVLHKNNPARGDNDGGYSIKHRWL